MGPRLTPVRPADIQRALNCSKWYSVELRHGRRIPHPRLYRMLAELVGVEYPFVLSPIEGADVGLPQ